MGEGSTGHERGRKAKKATKVKTVKAAKKKVKTQGGHPSGSREAGDCQSCVEDY
jgi:hypothetical protein